MRSLALAAQATKASRREESTRSPCGLAQPSSGKTPHDLVRSWVDDGDVAAGLDIDEDASRAGVVLHVAGLSTERDGRDPMSAGVDHGLDSARLVGDEDVTLDGIDGEPVGIGACGSAGQDSPRAGIDGHDLARVGCRREDPPERGYRDDAVDTGGRDRLDDRARADVEGEQLARIHVRDPELVRARIETRVVESDTRTRKRDARDRPKRKRMVGGGCRRRSAHGQSRSERQTENHRDGSHARSHS